MGGGNGAPTLFSPTFDGLSPRGRGKLWRRAHSRALCRSIPAWAGETCRYINAAAAVKVYPRVGGGNRARRGYNRDMGGLSPRGRGKPTSAMLPSSKPRSIPAWAGETARIATGQRKSEVYPRVGGGNADGWASSASPMGLSPRGRGKPYAVGASNGVRRSIPAWAGETRP